MLLILLFGLFLNEDVSPVTCLNMITPIETISNVTIYDDATITYTDDVATINGTMYQVYKLTSRIFANKYELTEYYDCEYAFAEYTDGPRSTVLTLHLTAASNDTLVLDIVKNSGKLNIILDGTRWDVGFCTPDFDFEEVVYPEQLRYENRYFEPPVLRDTTDYYVTPAILETVTEQVLKTDASSILKYVPPEFDGVTETYLVSETNVCNDLSATYETVTEQAILHEGYSELTLTKPIFETVTEQILVRGSMRKILHTPATIAPGQLELSISPEYVQLVSTWRPGCQDFSLACVDYQLVDVPAQDTMLQAGHFVCPDSYGLVEGICIKDSLLPAEYGSRSYTKLVVPAGTETTIIPPTYEELSKVVITNKEDLPDSCIVHEYRNRSITRLVSPATVEVQELPAEYVTRTYQVQSSQPSMTVLPRDSTGLHYTKTIVDRHALLGNLRQLPASYGRSAIVDSIGAMLAELGYSADSGAERIYQYLTATGQPLMAITDDLLTDFGLSLTDDIDSLINLETTVGTAYQRLLDASGVNGPTSFRQTVLTADCQEVVLHSASALELEGSAFILREGVVDIGRLFLIGSKVVLQRPDLLSADVVSTMDLGLCNPLYELSLPGQSPMQVPVLAVGHDSQGRKTIELDIPINTCHLPPANLTFIEGVGSNAGISYTIENGVIQNYVLCSENDTAIVYRAPGYDGDCYNPVTSTAKQAESTYMKPYPNPTSGIVRIPFDYSCEAVTSQHGVSQPFQSDIGYIDISQLTAGIYFIALVNTDGQRCMHRVVLW